MLTLEPLEKRDCPSGIEMCEWQTIVGYTRSLEPLLEGGRLTSPVVEYSLSPETAALRSQAQAATAAWARYIPLAFAEVPDHGENWAPAALPGPVWPSYVRFSVGAITPGEDANATTPVDAQTARVTLSSGHGWTDPVYAVRVLTHEIGHVLGLAHETAGVASVMTAPPSADVPTAADVAMVQWLYGART